MEISKMSFALAWTGSAVLIIFISVSVGPLKERTRFLPTSGLWMRSVGVNVCMVRRICDYIPVAVIQPQVKMTF